MWQPSRAQWRLIWAVAVLVVLAWPVESGSLAMKAVRWMVDPRETLPAEPSPIPFGMGDNADAVAEHDAEEHEYYRIRDEGGLGAWRLRLKALQDPLDPTTERQMLVG